MLTICRAPGALSARAIPPTELDDRRSIANRAGADRRKSFATHGQFNAAPNCRRVRVPEIHYGLASGTGQRRIAAVCGSVSGLTLMAVSALLK